MSIESTAPVSAAPPPDPAFTGLRAKVLEAVAAAARTLGCAPGTISTGLDSTGRHASMYFDSVNEAGAWVDWLHWPHATTGRDGKFTLVAYGQWLGFSWQITGSEPIVPQAAPAHREG